MAKVVLIHTVQGNVKVFGDLVQEIAPGMQAEHVVDESLLGDTITAGTLTDDVRQRFRERAEAARKDGADIIMLTCSSVGPSADGLSDALGVTVLRVDEAMAEQAVTMGPRVGVAATLPTTLGPTADLIQRAASTLGRTVDVTTRLADGAFQALQGGDGARHDSLVLAALRELAASVDVIVLAQASMARAVGGADSLDVDGRAVPILTSPRPGVERLREVVEQAG
ncbi:MAG: aspartate/glutamate racemase family protein [Chloroflexota bacterium]